MSIPHPAGGASPHQRRATQGCIAQAGGKHLPGGVTEGATTSRGGTVVLVFRGADCIVRWPGHIARQTADPFKENTHHNFICGASDLLQSELKLTE